jgi:hypothetical protein
VILFLLYAVISYVARCDFYNSKLETHLCSILAPIILALSLRSESKVLLLQNDFNSFKEMLNDAAIYKLFRLQVAKNLALETCQYYEEVRTNISIILIIVDHKIQTSSS